MLLPVDEATVVVNTAAAMTLADSGNDNTYSMTCTVSDGASRTATDTFVITVTAVNDAPYLNSDGPWRRRFLALLSKQRSHHHTYSCRRGISRRDILQDQRWKLPRRISLTDGGNAAQTTITVSRCLRRSLMPLSTHTCDITLTDGTSNTLDTYTLTVSQKNDEPGLTTTGVTSTFRRGNNLVLGLDQREGSIRYL